VQVAPDRQPAAPERLQAAAHVGGDALPGLGVGAQQRRRTPVGRFQARAAGLDHRVPLVIADGQPHSRTRVEDGRIEAADERPQRIRRSGHVPAD
jgi:hypothetical protein